MIDFTDFLFSIYPN